MKNKLILSALAFTLLSCGARKVQKSETEVKTEVTTTVKDTTSKVSETKKREQVFSFTDELEITPIDTTKAIEVIDSNGNKQTYFNAKIKRKQTQVNKSVDTETKVAENASKVGKTKAKQTVKQQTKETEKEAVSFWDYFWLLLLLLLLVGIYRFYIKYVKPREN
jgi:hypothetical protein